METYGPWLQGFPVQRHHGQTNTQDTLNANVRNDTSGRIMPYPQSCMDKECVGMPDGWAVLGALGSPLLCMAPGPISAMGKRRVPPHAFQDTAEAPIS